MPHQANPISGDNRIEHYEDGPVVYLAVDPDGVWARSEFPDDLVTLDYDADGKLIGVEVIGALAQTARSGLVTAIASGASDPKAISAALEQALPKG